MMRKAAEEDEMTRWLKDWFNHDSYAFLVVAAVLENIGITVTAATATVMGYKLRVLTGGPAWVAASVTP